MRILRQLTYANVVATLALLLAAGTGGAYALSLTGADIVDDTITSADIKGSSGKPGTLRSEDILDGQVLRWDIGAGHVDSGHVADGALTGADVKNDAITGADVSEYTLGQVPNAGHALVAGYASQAPMQGRQIVSELGTYDTAKVKSVTATCPGQKRAVGGGGEVYLSSQADHPDYVMQASRPLDNAWRVTFKQTDDLIVPAWQVEAHVVCVDAIG